MLLKERVTSGVAGVCAGIFKRAASRRGCRGSSRPDMENNRPRSSWHESILSLAETPWLVRAMVLVSVVTLAVLACRQDLALLAGMALVATAAFLLFDVAIGRRYDKLATSSPNADARSGPRLLCLVVFVLALAATILLGLRTADEADHVRTRAGGSDKPSIVIGGLTPSEIERLRKLRGRLDHSQAPDAAKVRTLIDGVVHGAPIAAAAIALWGASSSPIARKALGIVLGALGRAGGARATFRTTVKVGRPQLSLGGLHVNLSLGPRSPPICKCKSRCSPCSGDGHEPPSAHPDGDGSRPPDRERFPPTTTTSTIPMSP